MPRVYTRQRPWTPIDLMPIGGDGLVLATDGAMIPPSAMRQARNIDATMVLYKSRMGDAKIAELDDAAAAYGAKIFGADSKYATFTPPLIGLGGFWIKFHFVANRPSSGTATLLSSWTSAAQTNFVVQMTLTSAGLFTLTVEWESGGTTSVSATFADDANVHALFVYDAVGNSVALYDGGDVVDGPTFVPGDRQPKQSEVPWYVGVSYKPTVGVDAGSHFDGGVDDWTIGAFAGTDPEDEDLDLVPPRYSKLWELRRSCWNEWPDKAALDVIVAYAFDEQAVSGSSLYDCSMQQRHGSYVGNPSNLARIARKSMLGQFVGTTRRATVGDLRDGRINVAVAGGQVYYEILIPGA